MSRFDRHFQHFPHRRVRNHYFLPFASSIQMFIIVFYGND